MEEAPVLRNTPFDRQGMWVWYVERSEGGSVPAIAARAKRRRHRHRLYKGRRRRQRLEPVQHRPRARPAPPRARRLRLAVRLRRRARRRGQGRRRRGRQGRRLPGHRRRGRLRGQVPRRRLLHPRACGRAIGDTFPLSLAAFPYVDYHPSFPYSVFLGPGGATFNQPQMYWKTIGTSVRAVFEHTYLYNRIWGHPIYPIGQTYEAPGNGPLKLFRRFAASYGGLAPSWWSWQETSGREWGALGATSASRPVSGYRLSVEHPLLKRGSEGDMVVWAQERLLGAGVEVPVNGVYGKLTIAGVRSFQEAKGLPVDGQIGTGTWESLLNFTPYRMRWSGSRARVGTSSSRVQPPSRPLSACCPPALTR